MAERLDMTSQSQQTPTRYDQIDAALAEDMIATGGCPNYKTVIEPGSFMLEEASQKPEFPNEAGVSARRG